MHGNCDDRDYLAARLHARRGRLCEGGRLLALCRLGTVPALVAELDLDRNITTARALERELLCELASEIWSLVGGSRTPTASLLRWMLARYELEALKTLLRGHDARRDAVALREHLPELPADLGPSRDALLAAASAEEVLDLYADSPLQAVLDSARARHRLDSRFLFEAALTQAYNQELLVRSGCAGAAERTLLVALAAQEADTFHWMLVARGRFHHALPVGALRPLHVEGTALSRPVYRAMLASPDLATAARHALGRAIDHVPSSDDGDAAAYAAQLESSCWRRYLKLARRAFRCSDMGTGVAVGYVALRRVEVANLVTIAEGLRHQVPAESLFARLVPRAAAEVASAA